MVKGNCSGKFFLFFIPSIDRVCGSDAQGKKSDFLHGYVRRYSGKKIRFFTWLCKEIQDFEK